jgi:hypothetical protein
MRTVSSPGPRDSSARCISASGRLRGWQVIDAVVSAPRLVYIERPVGLHDPLSKDQSDVMDLCFWPGRARCPIRKGARRTSGPYRRRVRTRSGLWSPACFPDRRTATVMPRPRRCMPDGQSKIKAQIDRSGQEMCRWRCIDRLSAHRELIGLLCRLRRRNRHMLKASREACMREESYDTKTIRPNISPWILPISTRCHVAGLKIFSSAPEF